MKFNSHYEVLTLILGLIIAPITLIMAFVGAMIYLEGDLFGPVLMLIIIAVLLWSLYSINYKIDEVELKIYTMGILIKKFPIADIKSLSETRNMLSSPAASLDRIDISLPRHGSVLVSPKDKENFIQDLLAIHPDIKILDKQKKKAKS